MSEPRRVRPPKQMRELAKRLVDDGPFESKQQAVMFAAAVGIYINKRTPLKGSDEAIRWSIFEHNGDHAFIQALAVAECGGLNALQEEAEDQEDFITIFEEYANAGLEYLEERCLNAPVDLLETLLQLVAEARKRDQKPPAGLEGLTAADLETFGI